MVRIGVLCAVGFASALLVGCGELEPMREPEVVDLELTTNTLKAAVRDAQRIAGELRAELEARRMELAEAQVARAQLEGRVREAERRVVEARQVIELQREELAAARTERAHLSRSSPQLHGQMKPHSRTGKSNSAHDGQGAVALPSSGAIRKGQEAMQVPIPRNQPSEFLQTSQVTATSVAEKAVPVNRGVSPRVEQPVTPTKYVSVKPGDTLWSISQKYRVQLEHLRALNQMTDNRIVIGQALWLPEDRPIYGVGADKGALAP